MDVLQASFLLNNVSFSLNFSIILYSSKNEERKKKAERGCKLLAGERGHDERTAGGREEEQRVFINQS